MKYSSRFTQALSFLSLFLFLFAAGCASNAPSTSTADSVFSGQSTTSKGILWKIDIPRLTSGEAVTEKSTVKPSYVFGTIHSEDERVINLPEEVNNSFADAEIFAMEMVLDKKNSKLILRGMYFTGGRTLKSVTSESVYRKSVIEMKKRDMPENLVNMMKPWAVFTVLNMPEQKTGLFLDALLYQSALKHGKRVIGLESMQEQLAVFDDMKIETQVSLLESTLESGEDLSKILDETIEIYLTHDLQKILDLNDRYVALLDKEVADEFNQRLIIDRNKRMADRMIPLINEGNAFIAIGTLHLPGEVGVLNLLRKKGYLVTAEY